MNQIHAGISRVKAGVHAIARPLRKPALAVFLSVLVHVFPLGILSLLAKPSSEFYNGPAAVSDPRDIKDILKEMEQPVVKKNPLSPRERETHRIKRDEFLKQGEKFLEEFKQRGAAGINFAEFFIPLEYHAQLAEAEVYLMPGESLPGLRRIVKNDLQTFKAIAENHSLPREDKLKKLMRMVTAKSVPDPGAGVLPSLLVPEGGQDCKLRTKYSLILALPFARNLLKPGEQFVILAYADHFDPGIFNQGERYLIHLDIDKNKVSPAQKQWKANLYHPLILAQIAVNHYKDQTPLEVEAAYKAFLIARPNKNGPKYKTTIKGPSSPLAFDPKAGSGQAGSYGNHDITLERQPAGKDIAIARVTKAAGVARQQPQTLYLPFTFVEAGNEKLAKADYCGALTDFDLAISLDPNETRASQKRKEALQKSGICPEEREILDGIKVSGLSDRIGKRLALNLKRASLRQAMVLLGLAEKSSKLNLNNLINLQSLDLSHTPVSDLSPLSGLPNLGWLDLTDTRVGDLSPLSGLHNLKRLWLANTRVGDLFPLSSLNKLARLNLGSAPVSDLSPLSGLSDLGWLDLTDTPVAALSPLGGLHNLKRLWLANTRVGDLRPLNGLKNLELIDLTNTPVSDLSPLSGLHNLAWLGLTNTSVSDLRPLKDLKNLELIDLTNTPVSDLSPLSGLKNLKRLYLAHIQDRSLSKQIEELKKRLPSLKVITR